MCLISCHGGAVWPRIEGGMAKHGLQVMMALFRSAQANGAFKDWLASVVEVAGDDGDHLPWVCIPA